MQQTVFLTCAAPTLTSSSQNSVNNLSSQQSTVSTIVSRHLAHLCSPSFGDWLEDKLVVAEQTFAELERLDICQKASSPWASPLHIVTKKDGTLRPCGD
ncbi:hypothetical protein Pcinc_019744 [Petrolisthes cinctipes]|uniref:Uncharacterized protein n=1 Tax=Petrolisthes cinctipes TaxID=88211 RepID=A0AAE1KL51_PETCI|nr:hypothetical protein Pcinc_019744 [Petrolisthes cinctipes]